jgi:molybdopterin/thiamine biosynthesis adenylyltransferase
MTEPWTLRIPIGMMRQLREHLFPGDQDEHGAVIGAAVVSTSRGNRLLARRLFLARDGVDYVEGQRGYRMLTAAFVRTCALACADEGLAYLAVHCHGGDDRVGFSEDDMASHKRGYPALLDILDGPPVGGLVFARQAVAGDVWLPGRNRVVLRQADIPARVPERLFPHPAPRPPRADEHYDRQARLFGDRGQALLAQQKVGIIGAGGGGSLINEYLARLGVGQLVVIDPQRVEPSNLPRIVGARRRDTRPWLTHARMPSALRRLGENRRTTKVEVARRVAHQANPDIQFEGVLGDLTQDAIAKNLIDCDFIFLAADTMQARLITNALVHQYLIPAIQIGAKVQVNSVAGEVQDVFSVVRHLVPGESCLWCNELINPTKLAEEATAPEQLRRQRYLDEVAAPSVITLNAVSASHALNDYLFAVTGLANDMPLRWRKFHPRTDAAVVESVRRDRDCPECDGRLGAGSGMRLPTSNAS